MVAPLALVVAVALVHVWLSSHMRAPIVEADEFGYLYGAHYLALGGPRPATAGCRAICSASPYFPGYSLLLVPLWWASHATATVYRAALGVNTALAALTAWLASVLARRLAPATRPWTRALVGAVVAAYPSYLLFANVVESENLLVPAWIAVCLLAYRAFRLRAAAGAARRGEGVVGVGNGRADRGRDAGVGTWAALGLAGGLLYMVHPSALAATIGVVVVGAWVARPWRTHWRALAGLVVGAVVGLGISHVLSAYVTAGGPSNTTGIISALGRDLSPHGIGHVGVDAAGQLVYLLAVTGGLVVLAVPLLGRATWAMLGGRSAASGTRNAGGRPPGGGSSSVVPGAGGAHRHRRAVHDLLEAGDPAGKARQGVLGLVSVTCLVMLAVSVVSIGTGGAGRLDLSLYGRYNEAVLAPVLVAGALVGLGLGRRRAAPGGQGQLGGRPLGTWAAPGGLVALAIAAGVVVAARGPVLHGTPQATNILAAHALFVPSAHSSLDIVALAGLGAAVLVVSWLAWRVNIVLAAAIVVASFGPSVAAGLADLSTQSANVATELAVPRALVRLRDARGATSCVGFDTSAGAASAAFTYFTYRLYDPAQRFAPFDSATGGHPCSEEVVSARAKLGSTYSGAREVVSAPEALWVLPGPLAASAGRI